MYVRTAPVHTHIHMYILTYIVYIYMENFTGNEQNFIIKKQINKLCIYQVKNIIIIKLNSQK